MQGIKTEYFMTKRFHFFNRRHWPVACLGLALVLFAPRIVALGLGEINVTSKLGEHFSGRIPIYSIPGESVDPSCFKLLTDPSSQDGIPLIDSAILTVSGGSGAPYLKVTSRKRIGDLAVRLRIRAGCEGEITREYITLLDLPDNAQTARPDQTVVNVPLIAAPKPVSPANQRDRRSGGQEWEVGAGESLSGIAANIYPDSRRMQRRFVRHAIAANPEVFADNTPDAILPAGTLLHFPALRELAREPVEKKSGRRLAAEPVAQQDTKPEKPPASPKTAKAKKPGAEADVRLKLTTGDLDISASGKITEGEREILREKQRILMDIDDMAARNLSLNHRLKQMEEHIQGLQAKLEGLDRQRSEMAAGRPVSPAPPKPGRAAQEWPAYAYIIAFSVAAIGLLMAAHLKRKRKRAEALMGLDVGPGRGWEAAPEAKKPDSPASSSGSVNAGEQIERAVEPVGAPEVVRKPSYSEVPKELHGVSDAGLEITLGGIESVIEETDIYLALGERDRAIANLKYCIDSQPRSTADLWLKLLEIYRNFDMRPEFEMLATEFRRYFNIVKPNWETMVQGESASRSIEQFPHLMEKITSTWGSPACLEYLNHLLLDNRGGIREGFELGMASDILLLIHLLEGALGKSGDLPAGETASDLIAVETPSEEIEEIGALEFSFEPGAPVEPEKSDFALPELELDMLPAVEPVSGPALPSVQPASVQTFELELELVPVAEVDPRSALEIRHFRIAEKITLLWGEPEALRYLESLVVDDRGGRAGFDKEVISELMMLSSIAGAEEEVTDIWGLSGEGKIAMKKT